MFKANHDSCNPFAEKAYENDPHLQKIYNSIQEVTEKYPHIQKPYGLHRVRVFGAEVHFSLEIIEIQKDGFAFVGFIFIPR